MITIEENNSLQQLHTFHLSVSARWFAEYQSIEELIDLLKTDLLRENPFLQIGGGSNLLFTSDYEGVILHSKIKFIEVVSETSEYVTVKAGSGVVWDDFVKYSVSNGWGGAENLSLIPGEVGASAVQNIGAYGVEVKDIILQVEAIEVATGKERTFTTAECMYGYRVSIFKKEMKGKYIITSVIYLLRKNPVYHLDYGNLRHAIGNKNINLQTIRDTVIEIRKSKLPDPDDYGNAGSFFMNPVIPVSQYNLLKEKYPEIPFYPVDTQSVKVPAAWLIDKAGWKNKMLGGAAVHYKQCLVLINKDNAVAKDIIDLAQNIVDSVKSLYGITIKPEVNYI